MSTRALKGRAKASNGVKTARGPNVSSTVLSDAAKPHLLDALRLVPRAAWLCGLLACLNAACWSFVTPPFQAPDEPDHYALLSSSSSKLAGCPPRAVN